MVILSFEVVCHMVLVFLFTLRWRWQIKCSSFLHGHSKHSLGCDCRRCQEMHSLKPYCSVTNVPKLYELLHGLRKSDYRSSRSLPASLLLGPLTEANHIQEASLAHDGRLWFQCVALPKQAWDPRHYEFRISRSVHGDWIPSLCVT